jgi:hypothetical protein
MCARDTSVCMHIGRLFRVTQVLIYTQLVQSCSHCSDTSVLMHLSYCVYLPFYSAIQQVYPHPLIQSNHHVLPPHYQFPFRPSLIIPYFCPMNCSINQMLVMVYWPASKHLEMTITRWSPNSKPKRNIGVDLKSTKPIGVSTLAIKTSSKFFEAHRCYITPGSWPRGILYRNQHQDFFQNVVGKNTDCLDSSFIKYRQAINKFTTTLEDRGHDFNCEDFDGVVHALNQGSNNNNNKYKLTNPEDHHKKDPTRVISELDEIKLMESALIRLYESVFHSFFVRWNVFFRTCTIPGR